MIHMSLNVPYSLFGILAQPKTLFLTGIMSIALTLVFVAVMKVWGFVVIDEMFHREAILEHIQAMTLDQRRAHQILTGTVDVLYPFVYTAFFVGVFQRWLGSRWKFIAILAATMVIPLDLLEGISQISLLSGSLDLLELKLVVTPFKLALYSPILIAALSILACVGFRKITKADEKPPEV